MSIIRWQWVPKQRKRATYCPDYVRAGLLHPNYRRTRADDLGECVHILVSRSSWLRVQCVPQVLRDLDPVILGVAHPPVAVVGFEFRRGRVRKAA